MKGLVKEESEVMEGDFEGAVLDAALIGAARRVEHYEIAASQRRKPSKRAGRIETGCEDVQACRVRLSQRSSADPEILN
jgi:ferritin-like metal-binding protein YciE